MAFEPPRHSVNRRPQLFAEWLIGFRGLAITSEEHGTQVDEAVRDRIRLPARPVARRTVRVHVVLCDHPRSVEVERPQHIEVVEIVGPQPRRLRDRPSWRITNILGLTRECESPREYRLYVVAAYRLEPRRTRGPADAGKRWHRLAQESHRVVKARANAMQRQPPDLAGSQVP